jgi:hypothetical protein
MWLLPPLRGRARLPVAGAANAADAGRSAGRRAPARLTGRRRRSPSTATSVRGVFGLVKGARALTRRRPPARVAANTSSNRARRRCVCRFAAYSPIRTNASPGAHSRRAGGARSAATAHATLTQPKKRRRPQPPPAAHPAPRAAANTVSRDHRQDGLRRTPCPEPQAGRAAANTVTRNYRQDAWAANTVTRNTGGWAAATAIRGSMRALGAGVARGGSAEPPPRWGQRPIAREHRSKSPAARHRPRFGVLVSGGVSSPLWTPAE